MSARSSHCAHTEIRSKADSYSDENAKGAEAQSSDSIEFQYSGHSAINLADSRSGPVRSSATGSANECDVFDEYLYIVMELTMSPTLGS